MVCERDYVRFKFGHGTHGGFDGSVGVRHVEVVQVDAFDTKPTKTACAAFFAVLWRAIGWRHGVRAVQTKLGTDEDLISFASALEPLTNEIFIVTIHTRAWSATKR